MIYASPLPDVEIPDGTITAFVLRKADERADQPALVDGASGRTLTFAELRDAIRRFAGGLAARGFGPGDSLAIMAPNIPEYAVVFHGVAMAGGTITTLNPTYTADEIRHQLNDSKASLLVTVSAVLPVAQAAAEGTGVTELFSIDPAEGASPITDLFGEPIDQVEVDPAEHVVVLPYSSGTTGLSKGVMLSHRNLVANLAQMTHVIDYESHTSALAALPFFHIYGMQVLMNGLLANGVTVITMARFDLAAALGLVQDRRITTFFAVPPMVLALAKHPIIDQYDLSSLKLVFSGAAPLGADLAREAAARIGCEVTQGYGMTELSPVSHATPPGQGKPGSVGITISNTECRIVDADGKDQGVGGEGELWVRGPQVMQGYFGNESATDATIDAEGWLHTGDVGVFDEDGHLRIVDRVKELIKYKGFQVPPAELEALLITHPDVADVAVIGVPDDEAGELPKAFVVRREGASLSEADVQEFVKDKVASYKQVRQVAFVDEIPKSASGKILRRMLRDGSAG
ncbi:MAG TPA: 4-coumarate--CoA ligase family protein [Acidimicrobiales bacterium]|nr:4-coumarate--CoA ligase family protein [Acidimicrobiales bacterium]